MFQAFIAAVEGAVQVSKACPVYVFWAGQVVAAIDVCAAIPAPATTAAPATDQVMYLNFFDCRWPAIPTPIHDRRTRAASAGKSSEPLKRRGSGTATSVRICRETSAGTRDLSVRSGSHRNRRRPSAWKTDPLDRHKIIPGNSKNTGHGERGPCPLRRSCLMWRSRGPPQGCA
ncbi:hypothetical protein SY2F82_42400 [Streptomyces sp. Y2F8-2]|nr:hypothetical protein SY2F82_42400 [Streptomyces sp. Y2F8-2]